MTEIEKQAVVEVGAELAQAFERHRRGETNAAAATYRRALARLPGLAEAWQLLALVVASDENAASRRVLLRAGLVPSINAELLESVGGLLVKAGLTASARRQLKRSLAIRPSSALAWNAIGVSTRQAGMYWRASLELARALVSEPGRAEAVENLVAIHIRCGEIGEARKVLDAAMAHQPRSDLLAQRICISFLLDDETPDKSLLLARDFKKCFSGSGTRPARRGLDPDKRLRVAYVAGDGFRLHTTAMTLLPVIRNHDRKVVEVICYSDVPATKEDAVTALFRQHAHIYRRTREDDDASLARRIESDGVDIIVDAMGFSVGSRRLALARRPAPLTVNWAVFGSFGTGDGTFAIGDSLLLPPGAEAWFDEQVIRVGCSYVFEPPTELPQLSWRPSEIVTFGSLNQVAKLSERCISVWARVLAAVPGSRLLLKAEALSDLTVMARIQAKFAKEGVSSDRIVVSPWRATYLEHLEVYDQIDVALDPMPYGGATTTLEALLMGVPVVTRIGDRVLGRYGYMFLSKLDLGDLAAATDDEYVQVSVALSRDIGRRLELRRSLRSRLLGSPLCDGVRMARELEGAYRDMWRAWCRHPTG